LCASISLYPLLYEVEEKVLNCGTIQFSVWKSWANYQKKRPVILHWWICVQ